MKFNEALQFALSRGVVLPNAYYKLFTNAQRQRATTVSGLASLEQVEYVMKVFNDVAADGVNINEFKKRIRTGEIEINLPDYRLDLIHRTNIQTAYSHGRYQQQWSNKDDRPYLMYDALNDSRTRPRHKELDGLIRHIEDACWKYLYTPNGFNCRCTILALTDEQAKKRGITQDITGYLPDKGWDSSPVSYTLNGEKLVNKWLPADDLMDIPFLDTVSKAKSNIIKKSKVTNRLRAVSNWVKNPQQMGAYRRKFKKYDNPFDLDFEEFSAIQHYANGGAKKVNEVLNGSGDYPFSDIIDTLQSSHILSQALAKLPKTKGLVFRDTLKVDEFLTKYIIGDKVSFNGFNSVLVENKSFMPKADLRFIIKSTTATPIRSLVVGATVEAVIDRTAQYIVLDVAESEELTTVYLEQLQ